MELKGKTALVTGGGIRLGRAFALALAREGVNLVVHYNQSAAPAEETVQLAQDFGVKAVALKADFSDLSATQALFPQALEHFQCVDILINNAAIYLKDTGLETDLHTWETQFRINLQTPFLLIQPLPINSQNAAGKGSEHCGRPNSQTATSHFAYRLTKIALVEMTVCLPLNWRLISPSMHLVWASCYP